jgi:hypothetical protein
VFSCDFETPTFRSGMRAPPPAAAGLAGDVELREDPWCARVELPEGRAYVACAGSPGWHALLELAARHPRPLCNHRLQFDLSCLMEVRPDLAPDVLSRMNAGGGHCTEVRERLLDVAEARYRPTDGAYNLAATAANYGVRVSEKEGGWRLRYAELAFVPVARWPDAAVEYLALDALAPLSVYAAQEARSALVHDGTTLRDGPHQAAAHLALELVSAHGILTEPAAVARYVRQVEAQLLADRDVLERSGYLVYEGGAYHKRQKSFQAYVARLWERLGLRGPQTEKSNPDAPTYSLDEEAAELSGDPLFLAYQRWGSATARRSRAAEWEAGAADAPVHTTFDLAETGRTKSRKPNTQNRDTDPGDRECVAPRLVARPRTLAVGRAVLDAALPLVYLVVDVPGLELRTVAESCVELVGYSELARVLNSGPDADPHLELALSLPELSGWTIEAAREAYLARHDLVSRCRQTSKIANFGFPGGAGIEAFRAGAWKLYRVALTHEEARDLKRAWLRRWSEMDAYLALVSRLVRGGRATAVQIYSGRVRGGCKYTDLANGWFQGLGADATKEAGIALAWECYANRGGPLYGCRVENYVHDEWLVAVPDDGHLDERARHLGRVVSRAANRWLRHVPVPESIEVVACRRWSKKARRAVSRDGRLLVWEWDARWDDAPEGPQPASLVEFALHRRDELAVLREKQRARGDAEGARKSDELAARVGAWLGAVPDVLGAAA